MYSMSNKVTLQADPIPYELNFVKFATAKTAKVYTINNLVNYVSTDWKKQLQVWKQHSSVGLHWDTSQGSQIGRLLFLAHSNPGCRIYIVKNTGDIPKKFNL